MAIGLRRSMQFFAHKGDFARMIKEQVTQEIWKYPEAGRERFGYIVRNFLAQKKIQGCAISPAEEVKFMDEIKEILKEDGQKQIATQKQEHIRNGKFLLDLADNIGEVAAQFKWFDAAQLVWNS